MIQYPGMGTSPERLERMPVGTEAAGFFLYLSRFAKTHGDRMVNPYPQAVAAKREGLTVFLDEVHPTVEGHAVLAGAIWEKLEPLARLVMEGGG